MIPIKDKLSTIGIILYIGSEFTCEARTLN